MTERLYYENAYLTEFEATVLDCIPKKGQYHVLLDRSAFYPTSGGQPYDKGTLGGIEILDVYVDEPGNVWHVLGEPLALQAHVHGIIDWKRRFDHMQQHAADHMIASALWRLMGGVTIGLHISSDLSTIDVAMPEHVTRISEEELRCIEEDVNLRIQRDVPIKCWFPDSEELTALPLRKPPTVKDHVRVVAIGEEEMVACGGTHPSSAGQIGQVRIIGVSPARGKMRVSFLAGMRALDNHRRMHEIAHKTSALLSTSPDNLYSHVGALLEALKKAEYELRQLQLECAMRQIEGQFASAPTLSDGVNVIAGMLDGDLDLIKEAASRSIKTPGRIVLLGVPLGERAAFVFARSQDVSRDMGDLLRSAAKQLGGKGGGRPDFAQGGGPKEILTEALGILGL